MIANVEIRVLPLEPRGYPVEIEVKTETGAQQLPLGYAAASPPPLSAAASEATQGQRLWQWLMADPTLQQAWARLSGQYPERRIRLRLDAAAPELHAIPWEQLHDGQSQLAASQNTPFSRYLAGNWRPQPSLNASPIRILVAIANPDNLERFNLQPVDADKEWALLQSVTDDPRFELIRLEPPITLSKIEAALETGCHILHLVGHGFYNEKKETAFLYLADEQNRVKPVPDQELVAMLQRRLGGVDAVAEASLRLVYLSSCQTASRSPALAFRGLAPQLIQTGISAVVAMQDLVPVVTAQAFAKTFYERLAIHGFVDAAANSARSHLLTTDLPGTAIPVLFSRLKDNQLIAPRQKPPFMAPALPDLYIPRPDIFNQVRDTLLQMAVQPQTDASNGRYAAALAGAGGYGKTTLALALSHAESVKAAFPDGILWVELGERPQNLLQTINYLIGRLTGATFTTVDLNSAQQALGEALGQKRCLLILDDAWRESDILPFTTGGDHCLRLITTRNPQILPYGTQPITVHTMTLGEAEQLLR